MQTHPQPYTEKGRIGQPYFFFRGFVETPLDGVVAAVRIGTGPLLAFDGPALRNYATLLGQIADAMEGGFPLKTVHKDSIPAEEFSAIHPDLGIPYCDLSPCILIG
jgi:hypothetical protein